MGSVGNKAPQHTYEDIKGTPLIFGTAHIAPDFIDIDGYSNKKTEKGMLGDLAKAVEKYSKVEADNLRDLVKYNEMNQIPPGGGLYILEWEEVPGATRFIESAEGERYETKDAKWYTHIRFGRG